MTTLHREMGYTRAEFMRTLPSALRNHSYRVEGNIISIQVGFSIVRIELGAELVRRIASIVLPYMPVSFDFGDLNPGEAKQFLDHFDLYYRKGGG